MVTATPKKPRRTKTVDSIIRSRQPRLGLAYKLAPNSFGLDSTHENVTFDESLMKATGVISTPTVDRVGDLLIPAGGRFENYKKNPAVLWNHGFGFDKPIATSRDGSGNLAIRVTDDFVEADSFFSQSLKEAEEIFGLIVEGIVKGTSVRETPIVTSFKRDPVFGDVLIVEEWELEEWSWVPVGCNPDAVAKALDRKRKLSEPIFKSLLAVAPELKKYGKGFEAEKKESDVKLSPAVLKSLPLAALKALKADNPDDAELAAEMDSRTPEDEGTEEKPADEPKTSPYGSQLLSAVHAALAGAVSNMEQGMGPLEHPEVKEGLSAVLTSLKDQVSALEGLHGSAYADQPGLKAVADPEGADEESMKSFLAAGKFPQLQVTGCGVRLKAIAAAKNLTGDQRVILADVVKQMNRLVDQAKAATKSVVANPDIDPAALKALQDKMSEFKTQM